MKIFCDESGYSGSNFLDKSQLYFAYSGIALNEDEIKDIFSLIDRNYMRQGGEIKARKLLKSVKGKKVVLEIFRNYSKNARVVFDDKRFALAAKIFEYGVEPYLETNSREYKTGFHLFISNTLYMYFITGDKFVIKFFEDFLRVLQGKISIEKNIFEKEFDEYKDNEVIRWIVEIMTHNPPVITEELLLDGKIPKHIMDLTTTSLLGILTDFSKKHGRLEVICDESNILFENRVFDIINDIGERNIRIDSLNGEIGFGTSSKIKTANSKVELGIQVADIFATATAFSLNTQEDEFIKEIKKIIITNCLCSPSTFCVMPSSNIDKSMIGTYRLIMIDIYRKLKGVYPSWL